MLDGAGLLGLALLFLFGGGSAARRGGGGGGAAQPKQPPQLPAAGTQTSTPPWPQVAPSGLPPFPGAGWQYDEPPPAAVVQRAGQLVSQLWSGGAGTFRIEQTAGRWIAYRAEKVRSGKQGVVAYRVKGASSPSAKPTPSSKPTPAPSSKPTPAPKDRASLELPTLEQLLTLAQFLSSIATAALSAGGKVVEVVAGHWYQYSVLIEGPPGLANDIARGIGLAGGVNVAVSTTPPYAVGFQIKQRQSGKIPLGVPVEIVVAGATLRMTYLRIVEIDEAEPGPPQADPILSSVAPRAPAQQRTLPTLKRGDGIKPKPPNPDVKLMQQKLGIHDDGEFGKDTDAALRAYQKSHGLKVDGECGPKTWTSLLAGF